MTSRPPDPEPLLAVLAPGQTQWPTDAGVWILDLHRLDGESASARVEASRKAAERTGARTLLLNPPPSLGEGGGSDLAGLLDAEVAGLDFRIRLPALARYVPAMRRFVAVRVGDRFGARAAFGMELALDELCLNAIEHGRPLPAGIEVAVWLEGRVLHYRITNRHGSAEESGPFLHSRVKEFDASGAYLEDRGRGLFLVARIVDGLKIEGGDGLIHVHVWKELAEAGE